MPRLEKREAGKMDRSCRAMRSACQSVDQSRDQCIIFKQFNPSGEWQVNGAELLAVARDVPKQQLEFVFVEG